MKLKRIFLALALSIGLAASAVAQQSQQPKADENPPKLAIESFTHDFGELDSGTPLRYAFKIKNEGKSNLLIQNVAPACGCTKGDFDKVIAPGKEGKIELAVEHTTGYQGEVSKTAAVTTNDPKFGAFNLILRARFKVAPRPGSDTAPASGSAPTAKMAGAFIVEPTDRWISSALVGNTTTSKIYLVNNDPKPYHIKKLDVGGTDFTAKLEPIQDGRRYEVVLSTNPELKPGQYHQKLLIMTDSPVTPVVPVQLDLTVFPRVFAMPTSIIMPTLPMNVDLSSINWPMINVRKVQATGLKIKSYTSSLPFIKLDLMTEKEGEFYQIKLTIDSSKIKEGEFKGKVHIETNDTNVPVIEVPVQGRFVKN